MIRTFKSKLFVFALLVPVIMAFTERSAKPATTKTENVLLHTSWRTVGVPFADKEKEEYVFTPYDPFGQPDHQWGHSIRFEDSTFTSSYSAPCGMDCFTSVSGEYWFTDELKVRIKVNKIDRHGFCEKESQIVNAEYGYFNLVKEGSGWKLSKVK